MSSKVSIVNFNERSIWENRFILSFGAYGSLHCMVWADSLCSALDEAIDWLAENYPGVLHTDEVYAELKKLTDEGKSEEEAWEEATTDMTCGGNCGDFIPSWEWGIVFENPTHKQIREFYRGE